MDERKSLHLVPTGLFIRDFLIKEKGYVAEIWKSLLKERTTVRIKLPTYTSFRRYVYILTKLGVIESFRREKRPSGFAKSWYRIVEGKEESTIFLHPQRTYNPLSALGARRYKELREEAERRGVNIVDFFYEKYALIIEETALELGISEDEVISRLKTFGRTIPRVKKRAKKPKPRIPRILTLRGEGLSISEIAKELDISQEEAVRKLIESKRRADYSKEGIRSEMETIARELGITTPEVERIAGPPPVERPEVPPEIKMPPSEKVSEIIRLREYYRMDAKTIASELKIPEYQVYMVLVKEMDKKGLSTAWISEELELSEEMVQKFLEIPP